MYNDYPFVLLYKPGMQALLLVALVWTLVWKGAALWKAGRSGSRTWFVVLFLINTLGILDILYIFWFSRVNKVSSNV